MSNNLERLIRIYSRLRRGPVTIDIISKWAENAGIKISKRQLYRDLNNLQNLKIAEGENVIEYNDEKNRKTWKLEYAKSSEAISQYDINSFFLFNNFIPGSIQNYRKESIEKFQKILYRNLSKNKYQQQAEAEELYLRKSNFYDNLYGAAEHKLLENLIWVLQNKRCIKIISDEINISNIHPKNFSFPLTVYPYELLFHSGRVYITTVEKNTKKLLIYAVDKSLLIELTNDTFKRSKFLKTYNDQLDMRFGITEPITNKVCNIKVEYTREYALSTMNFHWHKTAKWKELKNGNYQLQMKCCLTRELVGFLAIGLDKLKIQQPKVLRELLIKKFKDSLEIYNGKEINEERANADYL